MILLNIIVMKFIPSAYNLWREGKLRIFSSLKIVPHLKIPTRTGRGKNLSLDTISTTSVLTQSSINMIGHPDVEFSSVKS